MYPFRGGPWDGFVIEYGERARPDDAVHPGPAHPPADGLYLLNDGRNAYLWTAGRR